MNRQKWLMLTLALTLVGGTALALTQLPKRQRLGAPGVMTRPLPGSIRLEVLLPEEVSGYDSQSQEQDEVTLNTLPKDTSFGQRLYTAKDARDFQVRMQAVLMGTDRTSLHKPQFCLTGILTRRRLLRPMFTWSSRAVTIYRSSSSWPPRNLWTTAKGERHEASTFTGS